METQSLFYDVDVSLYYQAPVIIVIVTASSATLSAKEKEIV